MPRVHTVKKAAKDYPSAGIKKGDTYYWWEFRYGGRRMSKTYPRPSQLTQSKMSDAYAAMEGLEDAMNGEFTPDDAITAVNAAASSLRDVASEYESSMDSMAVQSGSVYEEMEEKKDALEQCADELEALEGEIQGVYFEDHADAKNYDGNVPDDFDNLNDEDKESVRDSIRDIVGGVSLDI